MKCFTEQWQSWSSDRLISFHHVKPEGFYMLEFLTERQWRGELKVPYSLVLFVSPESCKRRQLNGWKAMLFETVNGASFLAKNLPSQSRRSLLLVLFELNCN